MKKLWRRIYVWLLFNEALLWLLKVPAFPYRWLRYQQGKLIFCHDYSASPEELRGLWM